MMFFACWNWTLGNVINIYPKTMSTLLKKGTLMRCQFLCFHFLPVIVCKCFLPQTFPSAYLTDAMNTPDEKSGFILLPHFFSVFLTKNSSKLQMLLSNFIV